MEVLQEGNQCLGHHHHCWGAHRVTGQQVTLNTLDLHVCDLNLEIDMGIAEFSFHWDMSSIMGNPDFCICENKVAVITPLFSPYGWYNSSSTYIQNFKLLTFFCDCTGQFVSDLVRNPEARFSRVAAHISLDIWLESCAVYVYVYKRSFFFPLLMKYTFSPGLLL